jgi:hypothetical protein
MGAKGRVSSLCLPQVMGLALALTAFAIENSWAAGPTAPGEQNGGILYALTHLPVAAYIILFLISALSVANLVYQARFSPSGRPLSTLWTLVGGRDRRSEGGWSLTGLKAKGSRLARFGRAHAPTSISTTKELASDGILAVRKVEKTQGASSQSIPTPLDGINHRLPQFSSQGGAQPGAPSALIPKAHQDHAITEFKFSSAVDLPSPEELERREKEQLTVSGAVLGSDGEGIDSVVVYLTDEQGTRIGQSCRSASGTGEFKVLVNEPGRYILRAYKRGLIADGGEPEPLPIEAGRIEGFTIKMIPEGCQIHGKVINETAAPLTAGCEIRLDVRGHEGFRSVFTDSTYGFKILGVPHNAECRLQVLDRTGRILAASRWFETGEKKEMTMNVAVTPQSIPIDEDSAIVAEEEDPEAEEAPSIRRAISSDPA